MSKKNNDNVSRSYETFDIREYQGSKPNVNRFDHDLFDEEKDVVEPVFRVKHSATPKRGEKWKIFRNNEIVLEIDGGKLAKKECEFLRTLDGVRWLIEKAKNSAVDLRNISAIKASLKNWKNLIRKKELSNDPFQR